MSMTCMHPKKSKVFSSLRRPETHFRHAQGHQRSSALTGSIKIFQSTKITVYEVVHQKTVNTKLGKQTNWFSEVIKDLYHYFHEIHLSSDNHVMRIQVTASLLLLCTDSNSCFQERNLSKSSRFQSMQT